MLIATIYRSETAVPIIAAVDVIYSCIEWQSKRLANQHQRVLECLFQNSSHTGWITCCPTTLQGTSDILWDGCVSVSFFRRIEFEENAQLFPGVTIPR